jgi:RimJ/RimL family protein N-acetyltransferase
MVAVIHTERLRLRAWEPAESAAALAVYGTPLVSRWLTPSGPEPVSAQLMESELAQWHAEELEAGSSTGHWAVEKRARADVVGAVSLQYLPPGHGNLTIAWALTPRYWGQGYAAEAAGALIRWAMHEQGETEVFAILQRDNVRAAATARRVGMELVEELGRGGYQVYRIRHGDLAVRE